MSELKEVNLTETLESNFARYAGMVIQDRAIVDVRDGLKPAARQLAYAQYIDKLTYDKPFKKATKSVASGMAHFYVHGDASAYSTLIRMGKPFAMRYPLEDVQGSYGNQMENDNEAASRYVEMRLSNLGTHLFESIEKNTIDNKDWRENYDGTEQYPAVLPSIGFYNLVQGSTGIGVALASSIPQFNLREMNSALIKLLWNPATDFEEIYCAPDFATGATIINGEEIKESIRNGTGPAIKIRAKIEIDYQNRQLIVTELPYGVFTNTICKQLTEAMEEYPNCGITKFLDLTGIAPLIKISLEKNADFGKVKEFLYKNTALQSYVGVNMVMLKDGKVPQIFGFKEALLEYLEHSKKVLKNKTIFDLGKAKARLEIVEGYLKALSIIDEVVALIKTQPNSAAACMALMTNYDFSERQAKAILDLKLNRLVNMEIVKIEQEKLKLEEQIDYYNLLLTNETEFLKVIEKSLREVSEKYGDDRRTVITNISEEAPIVEEKAIIAYFSNQGSIIAKNLDDLTVQNKNTIGSKIKFSDKKAVVNSIVVGKTTEQVLIFTNLGKSYILALSNLSLIEENFVTQLLELQPNEYVTNIISFNNVKKYKYVLFGTKQGMVKKTRIDEYLNSSKKKGLIALKMREDDELVNVQMIENDEDLLITTRNGFFVRFNHSLITPTARDTIGIKGIKLGDNDIVISMQVINNKTDELLIVSEKGFGKRTNIEEFTECSRAIRGKFVTKLEENDFVASVLVLNSNKVGSIVINTKTTVLKINANAVPSFSKIARGMPIVKLKEGNCVKGITILEK